jgi:hypothetical protein
MPPLAALQQQQAQRAAAVCSTAKAPHQALLLQLSSVTCKALLLAKATAAAI